MEIGMITAWMWAAGFCITLTFLHREGFMRRQPSAWRSLVASTLWPVSATAVVGAALVIGLAGLIRDILGDANAVFRDVRRKP